MGGAPRSTDPKPARVPADGSDIVEAAVAEYQNAEDDITATTESVAALQEQLDTAAQEPTHPAGEAPDDRARGQ